jgi:hypothetical protein
MRFWSKLHRHWGHVFGCIAAVVPLADTARLTPLDDSSALTEFSVSEDLLLFRRHLSIRILPYLTRAAEMLHDDILHDLLNDQDGVYLRDTNHPLPA